MTLCAARREGESQLERERNDEMSDRRRAMMHEMQMHRECER
jgi:hypothetical protein